MRSLNPESGKASLTSEAKDAIALLLGPDADQGDSRKAIAYEGSENPDECGRVQYQTRRSRYVVFPPLSEVKATLFRYGRG